MDLRKGIILTASSWWQVHPAALPWRQYPSSPKVTVTFSPWIFAKWMVWLTGCRPPARQSKTRMNPLRDKRRPKWVQRVGRNRILSFCPFSSSGMVFILYEWYPSGKSDSAREGREREEWKTKKKKKVKKKKNKEERRRQCLFFWYALSTLTIGNSITTNQVKRPSADLGIYTRTGSCNQFIKHRLFYSLN